MSSRCTCGGREGDGTAHGPAYCGGRAIEDPDRRLRPVPLAAEPAAEDTGPTEPMYKGWEHWINAEGYLSEAFGIWEDQPDRAMFLMQAAVVHALLAGAGAPLGWHR